MALWLFWALTVVGGEVVGSPNACIAGPVCDQCNVSSILLTVAGPVHVCCPLCNPYMSVGYTSDLDHIHINDMIMPYCRCEYESDILGNCWKGKQCDSCDKSVVGQINQIPNTALPRVSI